VNCFCHTITTALSPKMPQYGAATRPCFNGANGTASCQDVRPISMTFAIGKLMFEMLEKQNYGDSK
jgi:hypothetical protein